MPLLEQLPTKMLHMLLNLSGKMLQELVHLFTFMLHGVLSDAGCFIICFFEFMIGQTADFLSIFLADVPGVGKYRGKYAAQMLSLIHISEPTRPRLVSRMPSSA